MNLSDPVHKKVVGYSFIIFSVLGLLMLAFYGVFMDYILDMAAYDDDFDPQIFFIFDLIEGFVWAISLLFLVPRLIIGIGLVNLRKWANVPGLIFAIIGLINFPIGTALGVYAILVFTTKNKEED